ncbi:hypothetical protein HWV62_27864 [Athelia sp. TMB]|nr:hypothetical protein HWV62_27864 [Athelia sp. TMB]
MDVKIGNTMPGGDDFRDVTQLFAEAGRDMGPESVILMKGFTLHDAMSVIEVCAPSSVLLHYSFYKIGEPRLDSGIVPPEGRRPRFDPLVQFLPEEICWIIDRSFACEMEWHAGNALPQTVFTLLYVHHLAEFNPDFIPLGTMLKDPARPPELITLVLRSVVCGLLKSCDLAWREMVNDKIRDMEDWQSEKCDVTLLEGVPVNHVLSHLEEAAVWTRSIPKEIMPGRDALLARITFRRTLLKLMDSNIHKDNADFRHLLSLAREQLLAVKSQPVPEPSSESQALLVFDPLVSRRLNTFSPLRKHELPPQEEVWKTLGHYLDGFEEVQYLCETHSVLSWQTAGLLRAWSGHPLQRFPYIRSYIQTAFSDGVFVLNQYTLAWITENFFSETLDVAYDKFVDVVRERWQGSQPPSFQELERLTRKDGRPDRVLMRVPDAAQLWRLTTVREIVLSGFQLDLYALEERAFAYWYTTEVIEAHIMLRKKTYPSQRMQLNILRRYKWAYKATYNSFEAPVVASPDFSEFESAREDIMNDESFSLRDQFNLSSNLLQRLSGMASPATRSHWQGDRNKVHKFSQMA